MLLIGNNSAFNPLGPNSDQSLLSPYIITISAKTRVSLLPIQLRRMDWLDPKMVTKTHLTQFNSYDLFRQAWMLSLEVRQL